MNKLIKKFGRIKDSIEIPHLLSLQLDSYNKFLQTDVPASMRTDIGLEGVFRSVFPIHDFNKTATLEYVSYDIGKPKYDVDECISKGLTFEAPLRIKVRLAVYDVDETSGSRTIHDIKEQDIYFGTIPLITQKGTFLINGTERVIVNQLQRSPGIIFEHDSSDILEIAGSIERKISEAFSFSVDVIIRTMDELENIVKGNPFIKEPDIELDKLHVTFLADIPDQKAVLNLDLKVAENEKFEIIGREVYLYCPNGYARTKLKNDVFERKLNTTATTRNWKTTNKLLELSS